MATKGAFKKYAQGSGEESFLCEIYVRTVGGGDESKQLGTFECNKNVYDALSAGQKTAFTDLTVNDFVAAAFGIVIEDT